MNVGWICPRCGAANAPFVRKCEECSPAPPVASEVSENGIEGKANAIAFYRKQKGMTQRALGDAIGMHWVTVSKIERGQAVLKWPQMVQIAEVLGISDPAMLAAREPVSSAELEDEKSGLALSSHSAEGVKRWIRRIAKIHGITPTSLAREAGIVPSTINRFLKGSGQQNLTASTIEAINVKFGSKAT